MTLVTMGQPSPVRWRRCFEAPQKRRQGTIFAPQIDTPNVADTT
jgi:hypothetical protein